MEQQAGLITLSQWGSCARVCLLDQVSAYNDVL
jgi:hypothetical protein